MVSKKDIKNIVGSDIYNKISGYVSVYEEAAIASLTKIIGRDISDDDIKTNKDLYEALLNMIAFNACSEAGEYDKATGYMQAAKIHIEKLKNN